MKTNSTQTNDTATPAQSKYPAWFWLFVAVLVLLFIVILLTDPYYKQVPLWGIE
jgi:bacteriorhodopsin